MNNDLKRGAQAVKVVSDYYGDTAYDLLKEAVLVGGTMLYSTPVEGACYARRLASFRLIPVHFSEDEFGLGLDGTHTGVFRVLRMCEKARGEYFRRIKEVSFMKEEENE